MTALHSRIALLLALVVALAGCAGDADQESTGDNTTGTTTGDGTGGTTPTPATGTTPTGTSPTPASPTPSGDASCEGERVCLTFLPEDPAWSVERTDCVSEYSCASEGKELLVMTLALRNDGEDEANLNPYNFRLYTPSTVMDPDSSTYSMEDYFDSSANLRSGGQASGDLAFQIPQGESVEKVCYETYSGFKEVEFCHEFEAGEV